MTRKNDMLSKSVILELGFVQIFLSDPLYDGIFWINQSCGADSLTAKS
jgi:hypothetical protein